jgi:hypothetical protein
VQQHEDAEEVEHLRAVLAEIRSDIVTTLAKLKA